MKSRLSGWLAILCWGWFWLAGAGAQAVKPEQLKAMLKAIEDARKLPADSLHQWLRGAEGLVQGKFEGVKFTTVEKLIEEAGLERMEGWENGSAIHRRYKLKDAVFRFPDGKTADAYLFYSSFNQTQAQLPFVPTTLYHTSIGLRVKVGLPFKAALERKIFPEGSALRKALELEEVTKTGAAYAFLDTVTIEYGVMGNRWTEWDPSGFTLRINFVESLTERLGEKSISCRIASGLDPLKNQDGAAMPGEFEAKDTLDKPVYTGGSESRPSSSEPAKKPREKPTEKRDGEKR